jgi:DNA-binding SARP family transcriptional activator
MPKDPGGSAGDALIGELRRLLSDDRAPGPALHVTCFGTFRVASAAGWSEGPQQRRGRELLHYLVLHPKAAAPRERLVELFWPDESGESVTHRLHLAASALRASLRGVLEGFDALRCSGPGYSWHPSLRIVSDVESFAELYRAGSLEAARQAVAIYAGELLAGEQGDWLPPLRVKYAAMHAAMLERLARGAFAQRSFEEALQHGLELLRVDRGHEAASRTVMQCFAALGRRSRAVDEYEALREHLHKHLGVAPTSETNSLIRAIVARDG